jgi:hypothetical protein
VASRRVQQAGLKNVRIVHGRIEDFREDFDVGVALHACGGASDAALLRCVEKKATFVVAPCCVGKIANFTKRAETTTTTANACDTACDPKTDDDADDDDDDETQKPISYPRSRLARRVLAFDRYVSVARAADVSLFDADVATAADAFCSVVTDAPDSSEEEEDARLEGITEEEAEEAVERCGDSPPEERKALSLGERRLRAARLAKKLRKRPQPPRASACVSAERHTQRRACKLLIESDRLAAAREAGYRTWLAGMHPDACTPKNDVLVGVFCHSEGDETSGGDDDASARRRLLEEYEEGLGVPTDPPANAFFESIIGREEEGGS